MAPPSRRGEIGPSCHIAGAEVEHVTAVGDGAGR